jgi:phosphohistidine phosphatase SixA/predicted ArsR family transcriptional regulator
MQQPLSLPPEPAELNAIGVLTRREIEARLMAPLLEALSAEFDRRRVMEIVRQTVVRIARQQGEQIASAMGSNSLEHFAASMEDWKKNDAMQIEVLEQTAERFSFNVHRCRYAEMYRQLGIPQLGELLSCNRDFSLIEGFNPKVHLTRTQTIMQGAAFCDFRFVLGDVAMKTLLVLRHAKSSWKDTNIPDHDRPLNKRGKQDAPRMGLLLRSEDLLPDLIVSSTAKRARDTVKYVAEESGYGGDILWSESLYAAEPQAYIETLRNLPAGFERVMVVGHNPGLEELIAMLTDEWEPMPTAALAEITLQIDNWSDIGYEPVGKLVKVWRPRELS